MVLADAIADIHARSRGTYGMLRVRAALEIEQGLIVNKKLVWKIMRELGIKGLPGPTQGHQEPQERADVRGPRATPVHGRRRPNELWLTDITEHPTSEGQALLLRRARPLLPQGRRLGHRSPLRDRARQRRPRQSRHIDTTSAHRPSSTPTTAASSHRGPSPRTSGASGWSARWAPSATATTTPRWNRSGAPCRSNSSTARHWRTNLELAIAIADYIEHFYNPARRHSALGYLTPNEFEDLHSAKTPAKLP